jgi:hypothetical protein
MRDSEIYYLNNKMLALILKFAVDGYEASKEENIMELTTKGVK